MRLYVKEFLAGLAVVFCDLMFSTAAICGDDWTHWRGPDRNDIIGESSGWTADGWRFSSVSTNAQ